jgi:hypothetical protein
LIHSLDNGGEFKMNIKYLLATTGVLACVASPASAASFTLWQGDLFITAVNDATACGAVSMHVGDYARAVFRPKSVPGNGASDLLAWYFPRSAGQIVPTTSPTAGQLNGATAATIQIIYGSAGYNRFVGAVLSGVTVNPAAPATSNPSVFIQATIHDAYSSKSSIPSGCDITLKGTLGKRLS